MAFTLDCSGHRANLADRITKVSELLEASHATPPLEPDIGPTARGVSIVLLFGAYEQLLHGVVRTVLEAAATLRVGNARLNPGFRLVAISGLLRGVTDVSPQRVWQKHGPQIINQLENGRASALPTAVFPSDGSFMKQSQVKLVCELFNLGDPAPVLKELWSRLDTIVLARNDIAHGNLTADEVGRRFSINEMRALTYLWLIRWTDFIDWVEAAGSTRDFYRRP